LSDIFTQRSLQAQTVFRKKERKVSAQWRSKGGQVGHAPRGASTHFFSHLKTWF